MKFEFSRKDGGCFQCNTNNSSHARILKAVSSEHLGRWYWIYATMDDIPYSAASGKWDSAREAIEDMMIVLNASYGEEIEYTITEGLCDADTIL